MKNGITSPSFASASAITSLDLIGSKITDRGAVALGRMKTLEKLQIWKTSLTDKGAADLAQSPSLVSLHLGGPSFGDAGVAAIVARKKPWQELSFPVSPLVTDASVPKLAELKSLQILGVERTSITAAGLSKLRKALSGTKIYPE